MILDRYYQLGHELLDGVLAAYTAAGLTPPDTSYFTVGDVALDECPAVVVSFIGVNFGTPGGDDGLFLQQMGKCSVPVHPTFEVWVSRCVPVPAEDGSAPTAAELDESGRELSQDAVVLTSGLLELINSNELFSVCQDVKIQNVVPYGPLGGRGGWTLNVQVMP